MPLTVLVFMNFEKDRKNTLPYGINIKYVKKKQHFNETEYFYFHKLTLSALFNYFPFFLSHLQAKNILIK